MHRSVHENQTSGLGRHLLGYQWHLPSAPLPRRFFMLLVRDLFKPEYAMFSYA